MKMLLCCRVYKGFEDLFRAGNKYPIIATAPNGKAWQIQRVKGETPTFVASVGSVFGTFMEVDENE